MLGCVHSCRQPEWVRGKHNLTIGGQINWLEYNYLQVATNSGPMNYTFNTTATAGFTAGTQKTISTWASFAARQGYTGRS